MYLLPCILLDTYVLHPIHMNLKGGDGMHMMSSEELLEVLFALSFYI